MVKFSREFSIGTASSGPQSEGTFNKQEYSVMDMLDKNYIHNKITNKKASDVYHNYKTDIKLMKEINLNSFRTSIQWTRLFSNLKEREINVDGAKFYTAYFKELRDNGIDVYVNLFHFDMPVVYDEIGGFLNMHVVEEFVYYAQTCFELFDEYVDKWVVFNEPFGYVYGGYEAAYFPPYVADFTQFINVAVNMNLTTILIKEKAIEMGIDTPIGTILDGVIVYARSNGKEDLIAKRNCELICRNLFYDPVIKGIYSDELLNLLDEYNVKYNYENIELCVQKKLKIDFVGLNYYAPKRVHAQNQVLNKVSMSTFFTNHDIAYKRINPYRGWEVFPKGIYDLSKNFEMNYPNVSWYIAENGMGVENESRFIENNIINDEYRVEFTKEHLYWLSKAIEEGNRCFGYHLWTFVDNWSWGNAYKNRYGLISLDYDTNQRTKKESANFMQKLCIEREFVYEDED